LTLEFKLFALRHPELEDRLRKAFLMMKVTTDDRIYQQMFGTLGRSQKVAVDLLLSALGPVVSGLILESHFEPQTLSERAIRQTLGQVFDALLQS
jgi:hypothetical protein